MIRVLVLAVAATALYGQEQALMPSREALALCGRMVQLMESTAVAAPGLAHSGAPALESARQAMVNLRSAPANAGMAYEFLTNARAYLAVADLVPKPFPFPVEGRRQFTELREGVERLDAHFRALLALKERQLRDPDRDNLRRYEEANRQLPPPSPDQPRVVFLGDSITDGWRLNEYFPGRDFVNRGISGQVTSQMLARMQPDVVERRPRAVLVLGGTNDIARGTPLSTIQKNLTMIADLAEFHRITPLFASILPVSDYHRKVTPGRPPAKIAELNAWLKSFCASRKFPYVDYYNAVVDGAGFLGKDLSDDGLHPNPAGYRRMAPVALQAIDALLKAEPQKGQGSRRR